MTVFSFCNSDPTHLYFNTFANVLNILYESFGSKIYKFRLPSMLWLNL